MPHQNSKKGAAPHTESNPFKERGGTNPSVLVRRLAKKKTRLESRNATIKEQRARIHDLEAALSAILEDAHQQDDLGRAHFGRIMRLAQQALDAELSTNCGPHDPYHDSDQPNE